MEQIKIFTRGSADQFDELEKEVNKWVSEKRPDIVSRKVTSAAGINKLGKTFVNCTVVIFYKK